MNILNIYLTFDGTCADAMRFYERTLGGKLEMMMSFGQSPIPMQLPPGSGERIMHACLALDQGLILAGDSMEMEGCGGPYEGMKGFSMTLSYPTAAEAKSKFEALSEGGKITMPLQNAFWADVSGKVVDRFGTPWIVNGGLTKVEPKSE